MLSRKQKCFGIILVLILWGIGPHPQAFGYDVKIKKVKGLTFSPVPLTSVMVAAAESDIPADGNQEVGTLTLTFERGEVEHDRAMLKKIAAKEAAAIGANRAYQVSVSFDKKTDEISAATYHCIRTSAHPKKPKRGG